MPVGVSWARYLSFTAAAMLSMLAGSQVVHQYYRPLKDLNVYINKELKTLPQDMQTKIKQDLIEEGILNGVN